MSVDIDSLFRLSVQAKAAGPFKSCPVTTIKGPFSTVSVTSVGSGVP